ncbi:MAG: hypothetical protein DCC67_18025 [Planctomycetota bacterium]|nr:MAG: hypothetical protein DCC67_18025 [Planctomycetota bacterium]
MAALAQVADSPAIDGAMIARVVSRMLHVLSAIILGGGLFYMRSILSPAGAEACYAGRRSAWARWVAIASFLLLASGLFNFLAIFDQYRDAGHKLPPTYHMLFGVKVLLALAAMFIAAILAGRTAAANRFRAHLAQWLNIGWTAIIAIVVLGALLRAHHVLGPQGADGGAAAAPVESPHG